VSVPRPEDFDRMPLSLYFARRMRSILTVNPPAEFRDQLGPDGYAIAVNDERLAAWGVHAPDTLWLTPAEDAAPGQLVFVLTRAPEGEPNPGRWESYVAEQRDDGVWLPGVGGAPDVLLTNVEILARVVCCQPAPPPVPRAFLPKWPPSTGAGESDVQGERQ
jgi:hypothetical protein